MKRSTGGWSAGSASSRTHSPPGLSSGIALGLIVGKPTGIALFSLLAVRLGISTLPTGVKWSHIIGAGLRGGIGFTVSIFVAGLAFSDPAALTEAKAAILASSVVARSLG